MKFRLMLAPIALTLAISGTAHAACSPIAPASWSGTIQYPHISTKITSTWWNPRLSLLPVENCSFRGKPEFQGIDAWVFDAPNLPAYANHLATVTYAYSAPPPHPYATIDYASITFYSAACDSVGNPDPVENGSLALRIPNGTRYALIYPQIGPSHLGTVNLKVALQSSGKC